SGAVAAGAIAGIRSGLGLGDTHVPSGDDVAAATGPREDTLRSIVPRRRGGGTIRPAPGSELWAGTELSVGNALSGGSALSVGRGLSAAGAGAGAAGQPRRRAKAQTKAPSTPSGIAATVPRKASRVTRRSSRR